MSVINPKHVLQILFNDGYFGIPEMVT